MSHVFEHRRRDALSLCLLSLVFSCAHQRLSPAALERVSRPAFMARLEAGAGPVVLGAFRPPGDDARLAAALRQGMSPFEVSEGLLAATVALLPAERPWVNRVSSIEVASVLETLLVHEEPPRPPNYALLRPLGADAVLELVIERYGLRGRDGRAGAFLEGYGRMFFLDGGTAWRRSFAAEALGGDGGAVDPVEVLKEPRLFHSEMTALVDGVAAQLAADLSPARGVP